MRIPLPGRSPDRAAALAQYRRRAEGYDAELAVFEPIRSQAIELLGLHGGDTVIDVGCGTGLSFEELHHRVGRKGRIVGIERCPEMMAKARSGCRGTTTPASIWSARRLQWRGCRESRCGPVPLHPRHRPRRGGDCEYPVAPEAGRPRGRRGAAMGAALDVAHQWFRADGGDLFGHLPGGAGQSLGPAIEAPARRRGPHRCDGGHLHRQRSLRRMKRGLSSRAGMTTTSAVSPSAVSLQDFYLRGPTQPGGGITIKLQGRDDYLEGQGELRPRQGDPCTRSRRTIRKHLWPRPSRRGGASAGGRLSSAASSPSWWWAASAGWLGS